MWVIVLLDRVIGPFKTEDKAKEYVQTTLYSGLEDIYYENWSIKPMVQP